MENVPEPLSGTLALNDGEQILQNLSCFGKLCQVQPTSIAVQLSHLPRVTSTSWQLSVSCYQTAESHPSGWQSLAFQRAHTRHLYPPDTLFVGGISMLVIRNSNQLLKSICHSVPKKKFPTMYEAVTQVGFVRGTSLLDPFACTCMDFYTAIHMHSPVYTHTQRRVFGWILLPDKYQKKNKIKRMLLRTERGGLHSLGSTYNCALQAAMTMWHLLPASLSPSTFHRNSKTEMNSRTKCLMEHALVVN